MIKSILGGKSKNLCDVAYLLTLPVDKKFEGYGFWEVEISVEPNTAYTFSRENANQINLGGATYLGITNQYGIPNGGTPNQWLNHDVLPNLCHQNVQITSNSDGKLWIFFSSPTYKLWQKNLNPFGYIQLELGSTATEYVPHELTSYKSIMKVSDVMQVVNKPVSNTGMSLVGKSITKSGITCHYLEDGTGVTLTGTTSTAHATFEFGVYKKPIIGHKYLWFYQHSNASDVINTAYIELKYIDKDGKGHWFNGIEQVYTLSEYAEKFEFHPIVKVNTTCNGFTFKPQLFDLTEMFGAGNEPKTVAEFKAKFPNDYYPYSPSCFVTSFDERMPCKTKNLFSSSTEVGVPSSTKFDRSEKRLMEDGKWYIGLTGSNYYSRESVLDYSIMENSVYIKWRSNGYSVAKCIYCEPSTTYSFTNKYSLIQGQVLAVNVGFYTEDGTFISFNGGTASPHFVFTTPENCKYITICISGTRFPNDNFGAGCFSDLQLVKGTTATDYVPYGYV